MPLRPSPDSWIAFRKPNPQAILRLFCFPYAGGGASIYRTWGQDLPPQVEVCPVQLPGRENRMREKPIAVMEELIDAMLPALQPHMDLPFAFFGYSMGAGISHALAQRLARQGRKLPSILLPAARRAPHLPVPDHIHHLPEEEFKQRLRELNGTPEEALQHQELMDLLSPILRADFQVNDTYLSKEGPPLDCALSAFGGLEDPRVNQEAVQAWKKTARGTFRIRMLKGDHFFLNNSRTELLQAISEDLRRHLPIVF